MNSDMLRRLLRRFLRRLRVITSIGKKPKTLSGSKKNSPEGDIYIVKKSKKPTKNAFLYVPGFGIGIMPRATFKQEKTLSDNWDSFAYLYRSNIIRGSNPSLEDVSERFVEKISFLQKKGYENIVVATHSAGGLIAQSAILKIANRAEQNGTSLPIKGLIMFEAPHDGVDRTKLSPIEKFLIGKYKQGKELTVKSPFIGRVRKEWDAKYGKIDHHDIPFILRIIHGDRDYLATPGAAERNFSNIPNDKTDAKPGQTGKKVVRGGKHDTFQPEEIRHCIEEVEKQIGIKPIRSIPSVINPPPLRDLPRTETMEVPKLNLRKASNTRANGISR